MLGDGDVDQHVRFHDGAVDLPCGEIESLGHLRLDEANRYHLLHLAPSRLHSRSDAGDLVSALGSAAKWHVHNPHTPRPCVEAHPHQLGHHVRVGGGGEFGRVVIHAYVRLDDDIASLGDEAPHAAKRIDCRARDGRGVAPASHGNIGLPILRRGYLNTSRRHGSVATRRQAE